jgi:hypothetical protein
VAAALWRARSEGEVEEGSAGAQMREGERASGALGSSGQGRGGCELHARRGRGEGGRAQLGRQLREDDGADKPGPRVEREGKAGAGARNGLSGPKGRGGGRVGLLSFFFYSGIVFPFFFYLFYLIQIQISHKLKLYFLRIMHQTKVKSRVQHDAQFILPWSLTY